MATTRYAKSGSVSIAYQVVGEGNLDLVLVPGWVSHVEHVWDEPLYASFLRRLSTFSRLILLDRRGTGLSDPVAQLPTLEERMDDVRAVMDAVGCTRAALFGISEGGPMCSLFAASYPQRTSALLLFGTFATIRRRADYACGHDPETLARFLDLIDRRWGQGISGTLFAPSLAEDKSFVERWGRFERFAASPGSARLMLQTVIETDVREVLPSIRVPTLVLHRKGDPVTPVGGGRYLAEHIAGAKYVELAGEDHFPWVGDVDALVAEVEEFLTGTRSRPDTDRILATVLFTDIVDSTARATELGDRRWRELLEHYYELIRREVQRFRGREVDTAGDGYFAAFDGPARAIHCACAIRQAVARLGVAVRQGLHTGECERIGEKIGGIAVHVGARVAAEAAAGEVLVSQTVKDLVVGSTLSFAERGSRVLKGVPGEWKLFEVSA